MVIAKRKVGPVVKGLAEFSKVLDKALDVAVKNPEALPGHGESVGNPITLAPRIPEAATMADKMVQNAQANAQRWLDNVLKPRKDPITGAKNANAKYKARVTEALQEDRWLKGINSIDENEMYETVRALGATHFSTGIAARKGKITKKLEKMRPLVLALTNTLDAMDTATDQQREAKMIAARRGMIEVGKKLRS